MAPAPAPAPGAERPWVFGNTLDPTRLRAEPLITAGSGAFRGTRRVPPGARPLVGAPSPTRATRGRTYPPRLPLRRSRSSGTPPLRPAGLGSLPHHVVARAAVPDAGYARSRRDRSCRAPRNRRWSRSQSVHPRRLAHDRPERDMRCAGAAEVPFPLIMRLGRAGGDPREARIAKERAVRPEPGTARAPACCPTRPTRWIDRWGPGAACPAAQHSPAGRA
jgi:hypothetical protein